MRTGQTGVDQQSLGQPTGRGRIDDPLGFWAQWFSNRQVSSVFTPSLTRIHSHSVVPSSDDADLGPQPLARTRPRSLETELSPQIGYGRLKFRLPPAMKER